MSSKLQELHPIFRESLQKVLLHVGHLCLMSGCSWYIASAWRDPERQWELYKKGRRKIGIDWVRIPGQNILTKARPHQTPHCATSPEGKPLSCAVDIALVSDAPEGRRWLSNSDPRWGIIGASIGLAGASEELSWGGLFNSLKDCPHVELKDWKKRLTVGKGDTNAG